MAIKEILQCEPLTVAGIKVSQHGKQSFVSPTMPVGKEHIYFLFSPAGKIFNRIYKEGGAASFLMNKCAAILEKIHKYTKKK